VSGARGTSGPNGLPGNVAPTSEFFVSSSILPLTIPSGGVVNFNSTSVSDGTILNSGTGVYILPVAKKTYQVLFQINVNEKAQFGLAFNGTVIPSTIVGRDAGTDQVVGWANILVAAIPPQSLSVVNVTNTPVNIPGNQNTGGPNNLAASLIITQLN